MSCDALFQLGMGSVLLNASQTEDNLARYAAGACAEAVDAVTQGRNFGLVGLAVAALFRAEKKSRGNSAKALIAGALASAS